MAALPTALAALDTHRGVAAVAANAIVFLYNSSSSAPNLPALQAAGVKAHATSALSLHPASASVKDWAPPLIARL
jgi:hypothetical protein